MSTSENIPAKNHVKNNKIYTSRDSDVWIKRHLFRADFTTRLTDSLIQEELVIRQILYKKEKKTQNIKALT